MKNTRASKARPGKRANDITFHQSRMRQQRVPDHARFPQLDEKLDYLIGKNTRPVTRESH